MTRRERAERVALRAQLWQMWAEADARAAGKDPELFLGAALRQRLRVARYHGTRGTRIGFDAFFADALAIVAARRRMGLRPLRRPLPGGGGGPRP